MHWDALGLALGTEASCLPTGRFLEITGGGDSLDHSTGEGKVMPYSIRGDFFCYILS